MLSVKKCVTKVMEMTNFVFFCSRCRDAAREVGVHLRQDLQRHKELMTYWDSLCLGSDVESLGFKFMFGI